MANWDTGKEILYYVLLKLKDYERIRQEEAKLIIQGIYWELLMEFPWLFALKDPPGIINTVAEVTGTATITKGSATVTLGAAIATTMAGRKFYIDNEFVPYRILTHTAGTVTLTLDATYKEDSVTAGAFTIFQDEYSLASDCAKPWRFWFRNLPNASINFIGGGEMQARFPQMSRGGISVYEVALIKDNKVKIKSPPTDAVTIEYEYTQRQSALTFDGVVANDTPVFPQDTRKVIADCALLEMLTPKDVKEIGLPDRDKLLGRIKITYMAKDRVKAWIPDSRRM